MNLNYKKPDLKNEYYNDFDIWIDAFNNVIIYFFYLSFYSSIHILLFKNNVSYIILNYIK